MKAIICAAGEGKRLRPYTNDYPKCLLKIGDVTLIEHLLNHLSEVGVYDVTIVLGYKKETVINRIGNEYKNCNISYVVNEEYTKTDNMYSLWLAMKNVDDDIIFFNGDVLFNVNILKEILKNNKDLIVLSPEIKEDSMRTKVENNLIKGLSKRLEGEVHGDAIGIYKLSKNSVKEYFKIATKLVFGGGISTSFVTPINFIMDTIDFHPFYVNHSKWMEIDNIEDYKKAKEIINEIFNDKR